MAKFFGEVGYATPVNKGNGVHVEEIEERSYYGDVIRNSRRLESGEKINDDLSVSNSISIIADAYANQNFFAIRYVRWAGALWKVSDVQVQSPRLILRLGSIYHAQQG